MSTLFQSNSRPGASKIIVAITTGKSKDDVGGPSQRLRDAGTTVLSIGVGQDPDESQLSAIASNPAQEHVFLVKTVENLGSVLPMVVEKACKGIVERRFDKYFPLVSIYKSETFHK